ncbi:hypothetical protein Vadar_006775 [Vaccinium darrowii]|uniref:Uncharacterized protein n=1 Tax=Vaccinium darrowii TaxID=229202 RepID=A0ACB7ZAU6_9ERIC|nr:hypothetical protein Vadar_006775 [Vaccinium darrowii]
MTKVRQEHVTEINLSFPKESHLPQLPYLQACVKETLRLYPPASFLLPIVHLPRARRICLGLPMAAKHIPLVLASLIHLFDWSLPDEIDPNELDMSETFRELFTTGTDTNTSTVEWAMAELVKNAKAMTKVRQELVTEINQSFPKNSHLPQLPYLQACVKETLRLHPPAPFLLPHRAFASCKVMNYTIPKDAQVIVNVWAIGKDPMIWEDPLQFKPERFLNSTLDYKGNDYEFLPFGAGRRICPGLPMATKHVPLVLASLIHFFDWSLPDEIDPNELDMSEKFGVTLEMEQPLLLIPKVRK